MALFPLSRRATEALAGGLGAVAGLGTAKMLAAYYPDVQASFFLSSLIMFLASFFFISMALEVLKRLNAR